MSSSFIVTVYSLSDTRVQVVFSFMSMFDTNVRSDIYISKGNGNYELVDGFASKRSDYIKLNCYELSVKQGRLHLILSNGTQSLDIILSLEEEADIYAAFRKLVALLL